MTAASPPTVDWYACIRHDLDVAQRIVDDELASEVPFVNRLCEVIRSYRGKMLRPALLLLSAKATGDVSPAHHTLAAVVELVHMATLVHDDVLDEADERRRQPTIRMMSGNVAAVLLGDYLISHAFHLCSSVDSQHASRRVGDTTNVVCEGELLQNERRGDERLTESEYLEIIRRKTGALTAVATELGACFSGARPGVVQAMQSYGMSVGIAFQIIDDVLDLAGDRDEVGKTLGLDVAMGKPTLPLIHALAHASLREAAYVRDCLAGRVPWDRAELRNRLEAGGSLAYAVTVAERHVESALRQLAPLPEGEARSALAVAAEFILRRRF